MAGSALLTKVMQDIRGNVLGTFALAMPVLMGAAGAAIDYAHLTNARSELQELADTAALAAAHELRLANASSTSVIAVAREHVKANAGEPDGLVVDGSIDDERTMVRVEVTGPVDTFMIDPGNDGSSLTVAAEARVLGGAPSCMLGLSPSETETVIIRKAKLTANNCAVYSNSSSTEGMVLKGSSAAMKAAFICSSGGAVGSAFNPAAQLDCPQTADPLASRPVPSFSGCNFTNVKYGLGVVVLSPGVYCGGINIFGAAVVTFLPGEYIIKDGPFRIAGMSVVNGVGTGFYLTGANAALDFDPNTTINFTAPITGRLAGMLFFEDRDNEPTVHKMNSRGALVLLGTFYLPKSELQVGAPGGPGLLQGIVGRLSAWTIVVANKVSVNDGLNLVLNSDYSGTKVPVPAGVGPGGQQIVLSN